MEITNLNTLNMVFAFAGAALADTGHLAEADRVLALVGHSLVNGRPTADAHEAARHAKSILDDFGAMCDDCAAALVDWSITWATLPIVRANLSVSS